MTLGLDRLLRNTDGHAATQYAIAGATFAVAMACLMALMGGDAIRALFLGGGPSR
jgi:ABC-type uncharacterized transport system permease subunit